MTSKKKKKATKKQKQKQLSQQAGSLGAAAHFFQQSYTDLISQHMFIDVLS